MQRLRADADQICQEFDLRYTALEPERANVKRRYGICYADGTIKIRLRHVHTGRPLKYSSLVSTLCHELAHLRHFDHSPRFQDFYREILRWARKRGLYQPGASGKRVPHSGTVRSADTEGRRQQPEQLSLFQEAAR